MLRLFFAAFCLFFFLAPVAAQTPLNVRDFGAKGNGKTDDADAINLALKAAHSRHKNLYFPAGVYLCNKVDNDGHILVFEGSGMNGIRLYGDSIATRITTSGNTGSILLYLYSYANSSGIAIRNIFFENTHALINSVTQGIFFQGTRGQNFSNVTVAGCRFEGFSNALGAQGINGLTIRRNMFNSPNGHDNAKNDQDPAVYIWLYDNENGFCRNITIAGNTADGYTGKGPVSALVTRRAMDGFVYGTGYGFTITNNTTRNFSEEHYLLAPKTSSPNDTSHAQISGNHLNGSIPLGSMDANGAQHLSNYGIRCDISNASITGNEIRNYTYGIMVRGVEYPNARLHSYQISGNKLYAATDTTDYNVQSGIIIQGNVNVPVQDVQITGNQIHINNLKKNIMSGGIELVDMKKGLIQNNTVSFVKEAVGKQIIAIIYNRVSAVQQLANQLTR